MRPYLRWMWSVARKELLDIGRDRRTLFMALLLGPLMYPLMMFGMQAMAESRMKTELDRELEVPVIGAEHAPNLIAHLGTLGIRAIDPPADLDAAIAEMIAIDGPVLFDCVVDPAENCFPMIPSGKAHNEMLLAEPADFSSVIDDEGRMLV